MSGGILVALDPGKAVGYARFEGPALKESGVFDWEDWDKYPSVLAGGTVLVIERFLLYASYASVQSWSDMPASQVIGIARFLAATGGVPVYLQSAALIHAKGGYTPPIQRLLTETVGTRRMRDHERDAIAHGLYHLQLRPSVA
jgi:hypothetical protein